MCEKEMRVEYARLNRRIKNTLKALKTLKENSEILDGDISTFENEYSDYVFCQEKFEKLLENWNKIYSPILVASDEAGLND